ncbi:methyl-CpG-binding domain protein 5-like [Brienomyrus brachyistius]|uniref:methyl-CpG-binding domain protein 5-like n=1 Tax=Brienomyrus brachyistius TaxID=42636 RepID=UPI0020B24349|nr:methyl-CpG-binding domain protein 5-like [Brienomyrus brachyistius]XP_048873955.1 methyl-CpG-binding domain protein 5-like [Brienomyrus brachyistius]
MNGGKECYGADREGPPFAVQVPIGWRREAGPGGVVYISPSGSMLSCLEQVKTYLLTDGTCKCGLECPLILPKVFNFDPRAAVRQRTAEDAKVDEDVTKLCIHKRKIIAVATLHKSMETPNPSLGSALPSPRGVTDTTLPAVARSSTPRAIRSKLHDRPPNSLAADCQNPFKALIPGQRPYQQDLGMATQTDPYAGRPRLRLGSGEQDRRSPYRAMHGGLLSPGSSGSLVYGDGSPSPRTDPLGSPDAFVRATPNTLLRGSPVSQLSCTMAGRASVPLSPTLAAKSPIMKKPPCGFAPGMDASRTGFHHKPPPPPPLPPPPCVLQKKQVTSEKDPLGILDPIPSKPLTQGPLVMNPPGFQPSVHSQVPVMNVNIPPAIVPLPSNLPLPTVKPAPVSHGGHPPRLQHAAPTSVSSPPVTSPVHLAPSTMCRVEASPQRSRSSSSSSEHGSFTLPPGGAQATCGGFKAPPRSPRSSMGSPRPSMPSSPSTKPDTHHLYKEQLPVGMNSTHSSQHGALFPPASGSAMPQKTHPGLLGMPFNQILNQHNAASFPASSLLSAAAKAQLANQNKLTGGVSSGANGVRPASVDSHGPLPPAFPPSVTAAASSEGQSGRAALRDKLMAQQKDSLRKRKQPEAEPTAPMGPPEHARKATRHAGLHPSTSMAQLLQSMSCHSSLSAGNSVAGQLHFGEPSLQGPQVPTRLHATGGGQLCAGMDGRPMRGRAHGLQGPLLGLPSQVQGSAMVGCGPRAPGSRLLNSSGSHLSLAHSNPHLQQHHQHHIQTHGHPHSREQTAASAVNGEVCMQSISEQGSDLLNCGLGNQHLGGLQTLVLNGLTHPQPNRVPQGAQRGPTFQSPHPFPEAPVSVSTPSNPMACLFQSFQTGMAESLSMPNRQMSTRSDMMSLPEHPVTPPFPPPFLERPCAPHSEGDRGESVDAIYRTVAESASKGMPAEVMAQASPASAPAPSAMSAFTASTREPVGLPHVVSSVAHGQRLSCQETGTQPRPHGGCQPCGDSERVKGNPGGTEDHDRFCSPGRGAPRGQWEHDATPCSDGPPPWHGDEYLECSARVRDSPRPEPPHVRNTQPKDSPHFSSCQRAAANFRERLEQTVERRSQVNGGLPLPCSYKDMLGHPRPELLADDGSPGSSTSLEGPLAKDYGLYNGYHNGCAPSPSDTKSLSSEEELRNPDSPCSSELLHYRPRMFNVGDLLWGQIKGFPPWAGKLGTAEQTHHPGVQDSRQGKVEPEKLKTLTEDLEALSRATKRNGKGGKLNDHLEAAIQEAMSGLDSMTGSVHQMPPRDRQVKPPKLKRRKISR